MRALCARIVASHKPTLCRTRPQPAGVIQKNCETRSVRHSIFLFKGFELSLPVSHEIVSPKTKPQVACGILAKGRHFGPSPAVPFSEKMRLSAGAFPAGQRVSRPSRKPDIAASVFIHAESGQPPWAHFVSVLCNRFRFSEIFEMLYRWISENSSSGSYPPFTQMVLQVNLPPAPSAPVPGALMSRNIRCHGMKSLPIKPVQHTIVHACHHVQLSVAPFKNCLDTIRIQPIFDAVSNESIPCQPGRVHPEIPFDILGFDAAETVLGQTLNLKTHVIARPHYFH